MPQIGCTHSKHLLCFHILSRRFFDLLTRLRSKSSDTCNYISFFLLKQTKSFPGKDLNNTLVNEMQLTEQASIRRKSEYSLVQNG